MSEIIASETIKIYDQRILSLINPDATVVKIAEGEIHSEGPVYFQEDDSVVWSDVNANCLFRWSASDGVSIIRKPSHYQNGNYRDRKGRIVACSHGDRGIVRRERDGQWNILVDRYQGNRLNSPNDLVVKSDGTIWFTDPPFGLTQPNQGYGGNEEQPGSFVYRFDPETEEIDAVITEMERPNGIAFSPDESLLYVSDTSAFEHPQQHHYIRVYDVVDGKRVTNGRVFAIIEPGQPDGFCVDEHGNIFTSSEDSVQVYTSDGTRLGKIMVPQTCANLTFGGKSGNSLFIAAGKSLYAIELKTRGIQQT
ncbi:MAG: SMP-30/gluconolactonase/LRE family protein [Rivularia sp. (in: Bacteria)]|nr:SMP-30/gluconolactonase/LRE family protein [Rivularia sp. MS3]